MGIDASNDFLDLKWLRYVIDAACLKCTHLVFDIAKGTDENNRNIFGVRATLDLLSYLVTTHIQHMDVENDEIRGTRINGA